MWTNIALISLHRTQLRNKGPGKQRCVDCVTSAEKSQANTVSDKHASNLAEKKAALSRAEASGTVAEKLAAASALSAGNNQLYMQRNNTMSGKKKNLRE